VASVRAGAGVREDISSGLAQTKDIVEFAAGKQTAIGRDLRSVEFQLEAAFSIARARIARLLAQRPEGTAKIYALHAPEVECIAKGEARTRYELGVKLSLAVTNARAEGGQFVLGVRTLPDNPYDGHTLGAQIAPVERLTGRPVKRPVRFEPLPHGHDLPRSIELAVEGCLPDLGATGL
jgi:hypothetical protein